MTLPKSYFQVDSTRYMPLYKQIQENLVELVELGLLKPQDMLPSERDLGSYYGVNRMTVRQAINELVQQNLLERKQGIGTFVTTQKPIQTFAPTVMGFTERMQQVGSQPSSLLITKRVESPSPVVAHRLQIKLDEDVTVVQRLRMVDDEALMVETSYLPLTRFPKLMSSFEGGSLYGFLKQVYGVAIHHAEQTLEPTIARQSEADMLSIKVNSPTMLVRVLASDKDGRPVEFSKAVVRGDRCRYYFRVTTAQPIVL